MDSQPIPPVVEAWVKQLLDPVFVETVRSQPYDRIDIRLSSSRGRVSRDPVIVLNGGQPEWRDA
jgi:hypothetical protein